jgi:toxin YhaV
MQRHGWTLLFHDRVVDQLAKLQAAAKVEAKNEQPTGGPNANGKLLEALNRLMLDVVPGEPGRPEYRQGSGMEPAHPHWRQASIGRRFWLYFRYDSKAKVIIYAWVRDVRKARREAENSFER